MKKNTSSDASNKVGLQLGNIQPQLGENAGSDFHDNELHPTNGNPAQKLNKISSKKFFKSKIDFTAPIKSLQHKGGTNDPNLSDDSYMLDTGNHNNQNAAFRQYTQSQNISSLMQPAGGPNLSQINVSRAIA